MVAKQMYSKINRIIIRHKKEMMGKAIRILLKEIQLLMEKNIKREAKIRIL